MDQKESIELCQICESRAHCRRPCLKLQRELKEPGSMYERVDYEHNRIKLFKHGPEVSFSDYEKGRRIEDFSDEDFFKLETDVLELKQSKIFFEVFFNQRSYEDLADQLNIPREHVVHYYNQACRRIEEVAAAMDRRNSGLKKTYSHKQLTESQKVFLLVYIYGYSFSECAKIFGKHKKTVMTKARFLLNKYKAAFAAADI